MIMMKVLHYSHRPDQYGIDTFLISLAQVQKQGFPDTHVGMAFQTNGPSLSKYQEIGLPVHVLNRKSAKDPVLFFQLLKVYKNYDVINLHSYSPWAFLAAIFSRKKIVFTFHGALGLKNGKMYRILKWYYRYIVNRYCDKITFASKASLDRYCQTIMASPDDKLIEMFPYGLQLNNITPLKSRSAVRKELKMEGKFVIGTVARIAPYKKIERVIDSLESLPNPEDVRLLLIGAGDKAYEAHLRQRTGELNLENRVCFLGFREDVIDLVNSLDLFVLPTEKEPFGLALLEAMALGIPSAVFHDGGGLVDILGDSGYVVKTPQELMDVISNLRKDGALRELVSQKVKARADQFDIRNTAVNLQRIYAEV
jgi:glycosyltransferase involved in cell wall biosynthesis